jgi:hypothetical protein
MSRPFRAYRTVDGARLFAMLDNGDDHDIMWMAPDEWPNNHDTAIFGPEWLPVFAAWPGGCEIVPVDPPRPEPDAIGSARRELAARIHNECTLGRIDDGLQGLINAILAEVDRRIAAALAPAELGISIEDICDQLSELARAEANDTNATLAYQNHASYMAAVFNHSARSIRKGRINA